MPVHGRFSLASVCMRQLRRTCDELTTRGVDASAVMVGCDDNLTVARDLGFATVRLGNDYVSHKFNAGILLACDRRYNPRPADYVAPVGSDDFVDWRLFLDLPDQRTLVAWRNISFVSEDGTELTAAHLDYPGGAGPRIWPRRVLGALEFWPAAPNLRRGCDTSILTNVQRAYPELRVEYRDTDPRQIVDWKTSGANLNTYETVTRRWRGPSLGDPFDALTGWFPDEALEDMQNHYGLVAA